MAKYPKLARVITLFSAAVVKTVASRQNFDHRLSMPSRYVIESPGVCVCRVISAADKVPQVD
jgi:hypothetical protein